MADIFKKRCRWRKYHNYCPFSYIYIYIYIYIYTRRGKTCVIIYIYIYILFWYILIRLEFTWVQQVFSTSDQKLSTTFFVVVCSFFVCLFFFVLFCLGFFSSFCFLIFCFLLGFFFLFCFALFVCLFLFFFVFVFCFFAFCFLFLVGSVRYQFNLTLIANFFGRFFIKTTCKIYIRYAILSTNKWGKKRVISKMCIFIVTL